MEHTLKSIKHFSNIKIGGNFLSFFFPGGYFLLIFGEHAYRKAWTTSRYKSVKVENNLFEKVNQNNLKSNTPFSRSYDISFHDWNSRNIEHPKWSEESLTGAWTDEKFKISQLYAPLYSHLLLLSLPENTHFFMPGFTIFLWGQIFLKHGTCRLQGAKVVAS